MHFACLANTLLKDEDSAQDNHVLVRNFAKYLPIKKLLTDSALNGVRIYNPPDTK